MLDLDDALDRLAPDVDLAASRALFDRRRITPSSAPSRHNAVLVGIAAALVLVLGVAAIAVATGDRDAMLTTAESVDPIGGTSLPPTTAATGSITFELLAMDRAVEPMGTLHAAIDPDQLADLWALAGFGDAPPAVDLDRWVVVSVTIPDDACPPELTSFDRAGEVVTPVFVEPSDGCIEPLDPKTFVAALDRAAVTPRFTLRLPAREHFHDERTLVVEVPPIASGDADPVPGSIVPPPVAPIAPVTGPASTVPTESGADPSDGDTVLATVELPPIGEARSSLLPDGFPIWVVRHADGSVSALPAVAPDPIDDPDDAALMIPQNTWDLIQWGSDRTFRSHRAWDEWGRVASTIPGSTSTDLVGFAAEVRDSRVVVRRSTAVDVPGEAIAAGPIPASLQAPAQPPLAPIDALPTGWSRVEVDLVGVDSDYRLCDHPRDESISVVVPCPNGAPRVPSVTGPPGTSSWKAGPLLVEVDAAGVVTRVAFLSRIVGSR